MRAETQRGRRRIRTGRLRAFALFAVAATICAVPGSALGKPPHGGGGGGTTTTYAGHAYALSANLTLLGHPTLQVGPVSDTGELPATGGLQDAQLLSLNNPAPLLISVGILTAATGGAGDLASSFASVLSAHINLDSLLDIRAGVLQSSANAQCVNGTPTYSGGANIASLSINALGGLISIPIAAPANTKIVIPDLAVIWINHQFYDNGRFVVNALEVHLGGALAGVATADVVVSHAEAGITCGSTTPPCAVLDFVTGGGQVDGGSFGLVGGQKPNGLQGHLNFVGTSSHISGDTVTSYGGTGNSRTLTYTNSNGDQINVGVTDNGEPGTSDVFTLSSGGFSAGGTLIHGNIQLHHPNGCPTAGGGKHGH